MNRTRPLFAVILGLALPVCQAFANTGQGSVQHGQVVAQQWCSGCHQISSDQPSAAEQARPAWARGPSFIEVAQRPNVDREHLLSLSSEFYFPMPPTRLSKSDEEDVISYILSLKGQR